MTVIQIQIFVSYTVDQTIPMAKEEHYIGTLKELFPPKLKHGHSHEFVCFPLTLYMERIQKYEYKISTKSHFTNCMPLVISIYFL